jgi:transposase InsO family protein
LHRDGASFISSEDSLTVFVNGDPLIRAELIGSTGTLYEIQDPNKAKPTAFITSANTMRLWHRRMGHFSPSSIRYMDSKNMVKGLKISEPGEYDRLCAGCAHGKSHRLPLPNASTSQYSKMELLVMDLTGPLPVPTWDGKLYALVIVDAKCRYPVGRLLKSKDEVGAMVRDVVSMLERQSGLKAKHFRSDNGTEFVNSVMNEFCQRNGIIHETTVPYTPEQNGIAERAIAVLFEMIRSMLHTTNLDLRYWGEAFMYAVHIRSLMLTSSLKEKVPYEAWTGRKPDVSHLRIFGSLGWAHVPKEVQHGKLESRAVRVRMLGWWTDEAKGYRLEDLENGKLIASRDVQFDENDSPSELASIDLDLPTSSSDAINDLVDSAVDQDDDDQEPINDELITPVIDPTPKIPPAPTKSKKWEDLPLREPSSRERRPTKRFGEDEAHHVAFLTINGEPNNYVEMKESLISDKWMEAVVKEYHQLKSMGVFEWVSNLPEGKKAVGSRVVYRKKNDGYGKLVKLKARVVARGFSQVPGEDFSETFSSVAKFSTLRVFLSLAAFLDYEIHQVDIVAAYLQGDLDEEIFMDVPKEIKDFINEGKFWRLKKALYGLKQAGRQWKKRLHEVLTKLKFVRTAADDCLYVFRNNDQILLIVLVYVDDMAVAGPDIHQINSFKKNLINDFDITDVGELKYMLGIQVIRNRPNRTIYLNQSAYIHKILARFGMHDSHPVSTPLTVNHNLSLSQCPSNSEELQKYNDYADGIHYLSLVGSLLFATQTRPDIQFAVGLVAQFSKNPGIPHLAASKRILRYLKGTTNFHLVLGQRDSEKLNLIGWSDASWAQDPDTRKSVSGFVFDIYGGSVSWSSKKQSIVATSTMEAEYIASSNATKEAIWLRTLLKELDFPQTTATIIFADNQGCIALSNNPISHSRAKHIDIRYHFVRERVEHNEINLQFVSTKDMLADIFTKALPREAFVKFRDRLGVILDISSSGSVEK